MKKLIFLVLFISATVQAEYWVETGATPSSLRANGAELISSDSLKITKGKIALVTYWNFARGKSDRDYYRCVDTVTEEFVTKNHQCWKVKTAAQRRPIE